jgi:hypothetical protein
MLAFAVLASLGYMRAFAAVLASLGYMRAFAACCVSDLHLLFSSQVKHCVFDLGRNGKTTSMQLAVACWLALQTGLCCCTLLCLQT